MGCKGSQIYPNVPVLFIPYSSEGLLWFFYGDVTVINVLAQLDVGMCVLLGGRAADRFVLNPSNDSESPNAPCLFWSLCFVKNQMEWGMLSMWRELPKARGRLWRLLGISYTVNIDMATAWIIRRLWMCWEQGIITGDCREPGSLARALSLFSAPSFLILSIFLLLSASVCFFLSLCLGWS